MATYKLPNGVTFEKLVCGDEYSDHLTPDIIPVQIEEIEFEYFDPSNPIPCELQEYVKEVFKDAKIHYRKRSICNEDTGELKEYMTYFITAERVSHDEYSPLTDPKVIPQKELWMEIVFRFEDVTSKYYVPLIPTACTFMEDVALSVYQVHKNLSTNQINQKEIVMFDEVGWERKLVVENQSTLLSLVVSAKYVKKN